MVDIVPCAMESVFWDILEYNLATCHLFSIVILLQVLDRHNLNNQYAKLVTNLSNKPKAGVTFFNSS